MGPRGPNVGSKHAGIESPARHVAQGAPTTRPSHPAYTGGGDRRRRGAAERARTNPPAASKGVRAKAVEARRSAPAP
jgi:hypothetical protein